MNTQTKPVEAKSPRKHPERRFAIISSGSYGLGLKHEGRGTRDLTAEIALSCLIMKRTD